MIVQISATLLNPPLQVDAGSVVTLRGWYTNSFVAGDGVTAVQGGGNGQNGFYYEVTCTVDGDGNVTIPAFNVQATTDSSPTAGFFGQLFVDDAPNRFVFGLPQATAGWQIPTVYGSVVTYDQLAVYNAAVTLLFASQAFFTQDQTIQEIERIAGELSYAGFGILGRTQLSIAPDDPSIPIAFGSNDPAVGDLHGTLTTSAVPRVTDTHTLGDGLPTDDGTDWGIQTENYVQLGDYQNLVNGTKFAINDTFKLFQLLAGETQRAEYAGIVANATAPATVEVQGTGYSYLKNTAAGVLALGDGAGDNNGTKVTIDDVQQLIILTNVPTADPHVVGAIWNSSGTLKISAG